MKCPQNDRFKYLAVRLVPFDMFRECAPVTDHNFEWITSDRCEHVRL